MCKAILLCERTMVDTGTGRTSLPGIIRVQTLRDFPGRTSPTKIFLHLVDGIGEYAITVEIHDLAEDSIVVRMKAPAVSFPRRPFSHQLSLKMPAIPILIRDDMMWLCWEMEKKSIANSSAPNCGFAQKLWTRVKTLRMRKAGKWEFGFSCLPAFLILILPLSFRAKPPIAKKRRRKPVKPKRTTKAAPSTSIPGTWIDTDDLVTEGETKEIAEGVWVASLTLTVLDPPEPIKKPAKRKSPKPKK